MAQFFVCFCSFQIRHEMLIVLLQKAKIAVSNEYLQDMVTSEWKVCLLSNLLCAMLHKTDLILFQVSELLSENKPVPCLRDGASSEHSKRSVVLFILSL